MSQPDVSVLMPVYNGINNYPPQMLETVIRKTLEQTGISLEMCIVNNGSADDTRKVLWGLADHAMNIRIKTLHKNRGAAAGMNAALHMARGKYIVFQSVRSWYEAGALAAMVAALDERPGVGFVYGCTQYHGERTDLYTPPPFMKERFFHNFDSLFGYMYRREAHEAGCEYVSYMVREGKNLDIFDWDFIMQLIVGMGWNGLALRDVLCLHYLYTPSKGQMTNYVHKYNAELRTAFLQRWGA